MSDIFNLVKRGEFWKLEYTASGPRPGEHSGSERSMVPKGTQCALSMTKAELSDLRRVLSINLCKNCENNRPPVISYDMKRFEMLESFVNKLKFDSLSERTTQLEAAKEADALHFAEIATKIKALDVSALNMRRAYVAQAEHIMALHDHYDKLRKEADKPAEHQGTCGCKKANRKRTVTK